MECFISLIVSSGSQITRYEAERKLRTASRWNKASLIVGIVLYILYGLYIFFRVNKIMGEQQELQAHNY